MQWKLYHVPYMEDQSALHKLHLQVAIFVSRFTLKLAWNVIQGFRLQRVHACIGAPIRVL